MPDGFRFPVNSQMWMPLTPTPELEKRDDRSLNVFAMLKPGVVGALQASVELNAIAHRSVSNIQHGQGHDRPR